MKSFTTALFAFALFCTSQFSYAQSLKSNMKSTETLLKQVASKMNDASKNQENAALVAKMIANFEVAKNQTPDAGSFSEYQALMNQSMLIMKELQDAFNRNDNAAVLSIMQKINTNKKEGHDKFK